MDFTKLSIKNFIGDLPRIINENFDVIKNFINTVFNTGNTTIPNVTANLNKVNTTTIDVNTVNVSNDILIKYKGTNVKISLNEIIKQLIDKGVIKYDELS